MEIKMLDKETIPAKNLLCDTKPMDTIIFSQSKPAFKWNINPSKRQ